ncbi:unnamed protein product, partial [Laminaria digitata]
MGGCLNPFCKIQASYSVLGSKKAAYCKKHAEDGMVLVHHKRCSHDTCLTTPSFNAKGSKGAA